MKFKDERMTVKQKFGSSDDVYSFEHGLKWLSFLNSKKTPGNENQRTNGPVKAHLISWPSKAQNIQNLENIWQRNDVDLHYSHTFLPS